MYYVYVFMQNSHVIITQLRKFVTCIQPKGRGQGGAVNITCVQYLLIQQFYAIHFAIHLVLPVVCDRESFLVVFECRDSDQS